MDMAEALIYVFSVSVAGGIIIAFLRTISALFGEEKA